MSNRGSYAAIVVWRWRGTVSRRRGRPRASWATSKRCLARGFAVELPSLDGKGPMAADFRVFLSAVTSEFGAARDALANDLQGRDVQVRVQRSFRQEPGSDTLLRLLHDYIAGCNAVVCVIGKRSGACPPPAAAAAFAHMLPPGISEASYTQWEFFFARAHKRRLSLYLAEPDYQPDKDQPGNDIPGLQEAFIRHIKAEGLHRV